MDFVFLCTYLYIYYHVYEWPTKFTYNTAAGQHYKEATKRTSSAHDPRQSNKKDNAEDILNARQVDANKGAHAGAPGLRLGVRVGGGGSDSVGIVGEGVEQGWHPGAVLHLFLKR